MSGLDVPRIVVMGVAGAGKTTVGVSLAGELGVPFVDGDSLHSAENVAKMSSGTPLDDEDRRPWLQSVGAELERHAAGVVVACSALKRAYRDRIRDESPGVFFVHMVADRDTLAERMAARRDHYMPVALLDSQLDLLELLEGDEHGIVLSATEPVAEVVSAALSGWSIR